MVRTFFSTGILDEHLKETNIALILKKQNPEFMIDIRHISLCNVIYKVIYKVLAKKLKKVVDSINSDSQSAFIAGRLITDNIIITFEALHYMRRKTKGKKMLDGLETRHV